MGAATRDRVSDLHDLVTEALIAQIKAVHEGRLVELKGEEYVKVMPAALVTAAIKFLNDNGIEAAAVPGSRVEKLKATLHALPFPTSATGTDS